MIFEGLLSSCRGGSPAGIVEPNYKLGELSASAASFPDLLIVCFHKIVDLAVSEGAAEVNPTVTASSTGLAQIPLHNTRMHPHQ